MNKWSIDRAPSQVGKVAIVTGANSGIGYETVRGLVRKDMEVILACRNMQKAEEAVARLRQMHPDARLRPMMLDLSRLADVRKFAA